MAASFTCDGCGAAVDKPKQVGHVLKRDYCEACTVRAEAFVDAEEAERVAVQVVFAGKREKLIAEFGAGNFKLPDVPDAA